MSRRPRRNVSLDVPSLEPRLAPVGFYQGPPLAPSYISLHGEISAAGVIHPLRSGGETITLSGAGSLSPIGRTTVRGTLRVAGNTENGTLTLQSARYRLTVNLVGHVPSSSSTGASVLAESISGQGPMPYSSTELFVNERGGGTVEVVAGAGQRHAAYTLVFLG